MFTLSFWVGAGVAFAISVAASVLANLSHPKLVQWLDNRKLTSRTKRKETAVRQRNIVLDLRSGRRDKVSYMARLSSGITMAFTSAVVAFVGSVIIFALHPVPTDFVVDHDLQPLVFNLALIFLFAFFMYLTSKSVRRFHEIVNGLEDFDGYEREFQAKWGQVEDAQQGASNSTK